MRFEARELPPHGEPVVASELKEGEVYFSVQFVDDELHKPIMETLVFIGRNLGSGDVGQLYFQDIESYRDGIRYGSTIPDDIPKIRRPYPYPLFYSQAENQVGHIFEFEHALEQLMKCSLRRRGRAIG